MQEKLALIVGPTGVGKSTIGIKLAQKIGGEIISGDSVQVYRKLDIGSAKIIEAEQEGIPHHMLDILDPDETFSAALFRERVRGLISDINSRGKIPILVGGTGLYVRSVIDPYNFPDKDNSPLIRAELLELAKQLGNEALHRTLSDVDPISAARLHPNDITRVVRALEVYRLTGKTLTSFRQLPALPEQSESPYALSYFGLTAPRDVIYERINLRVDQMIEQGLINEVQNLLDEGLSPNLSALRSIGYRHAVLMLRGFLTVGEMIRLLKRDTRRFAKRQFTWFTRDARITWFDIVDLEAELIVNQMAKSICRAG